MKNKSTLKVIVPAAVLLIMAPLLFKAGFLCLDGFRLGAVYYALVLLLSFFSREFSRGNNRENSKEEKTKTVFPNLLIAVQLIFIAGVPAGMLLHSEEQGGLSFFLNHRITQYIYLEGTALILLFLSAGFYARVKALYTGKLRRNLLSPLTGAVIIRAVFMIIFEFRQLYPLSEQSASTGIGYIVLMSLPLLLVPLITNVYRLLAGYVVGIGLALFQLACTIVFAAIGFINGGTLAVTIIAVLILGFFSVKGIMEYHYHNAKKLPALGYFIMRTMLKVKRALGNIPGLLEKAGVTQGMNVLDYGCGIGNFSIASAKLVGESGHVTSVDINEKMLQALTKRSDSEGLSNITPVHASRPEDVPEKGFDFILLIDVLHQIASKESVLSSLLEKLAPEGRLLIKFEHFPVEHINELLGKLTCSYKARLVRHYWLVGR